MTAEEMMLAVIGGQNLHRVVLWSGFAINISDLVSNKENEQES